MSLFITKTKIYLQKTAVDCGACAVLSVLNLFYSKIKRADLNPFLIINRYGTSLKNIKAALLSFKIKSDAKKYLVSDLKKVKLAILHVKNSHFVVYEGYFNKKFYINDPSVGRYSLSENKIRHFYSNKALVITPPSLKQRVFVFLSSIDLISVFKVSFYFLFINICTLFLFYLFKNAYNPYIFDIHNAYFYVSFIFVFTVFVFCSCVIFVLPSKISQKSAFLSAVFYAFLLKVQGIFLLFLLLIDFIKKNIKKTNDQKINILTFLIRQEKKLIPQSKLMGRNTILQQSLQEKLRSIWSIKHSFNFLHAVAIAIILAASLVFDIELVAFAWIFFCLSKEKKIKVKKNIFKENIVQPTIIRKNLLKTDELISVQNVSFAYPGEERHILQNMSFKLLANKIYGISSATEGGKSTLIKLLTCINKPVAGNIFYQQNTKAFLLANKKTIIDGSIWDNLVYFASFPTTDKVYDVIKLLCLADVFEKKELGLLAPIKKDGSNLSYGQIKRIMLAQALLAGANIIFLDDFFVSLDEKMARKIYGNIRSLPITFVTTLFADFEKQYVDEFLHIKPDGILDIKVKDEF